MIQDAIGVLLKQHDCVIIPGFGGFIANYKSAKIHPTEHTFTPPSKSIAFNKILDYNDGILAKHIAEANPTSYENALKAIESFVAESNNKLKSNEVIIFKGVGKLYSDVEQNIQFTPIVDENYLKEAYGLKEVQFYPIIRSKKEVAAAVAIEKTELTIAEKPTQEKKKSKTWLVAALILVLIGIGVLSSLIGLDVNSDKLTLQNAGVHSFVSSLFGGNKTGESIKPNITPHTKPMAVLNGFEDSSNSNTNDDETSNGNDAENETLIEIDNGNSSTNNTNPHKVDNTNTQTNNAVINTDNPQTGYYMIVGSFKSLNKAKNLSNRLGNTVVFAGPNGFSRVGYFVSNQKDSAVNQIQEARQTQQGAWVHYQRF